MQRAQETCDLAGLGDNAVIDSEVAALDYVEYEEITSSTRR